MSPVGPGAERGKPWLNKTCARCGRHRRYSAIWPDGHVCRTCQDRALKVRGRCPSCGKDRALPGVRLADKQPICTDCAGFSVSYQCSRCGDEDTLHADRLCARCTFADQLAELLDDGTGRIRPALVPLAEHLLAMNNPKSGLSWLRPSHRPARPPAVLLQELGRGEIELTHEAFHSVQPWRAAAHLRELLMASGVLPPVDKQIWCMTNKLIRRVRLPPQVIRTAAPLPPPQRLELLGRLLVEHDQPLRTRVAAAIVLLYAQPLARIVRLTLDDVLQDGDQVLLRLGEPPSPVPGPVAGLLLRWIEQRTNMGTATNRVSHWLFPGRRAGQPLSPETLGTQVKAIGIPTVAARTGAIREHVLGMPAPVVADALGYNHVTTTRLATESATPWSQYAPGNHT